MNTPSPITAAEEDGLDDAATFDPDGERTERRLRVLERLTDLGMELAERLAAQVRASDEDAAETVDVAAVGGSFAKIARAVRLTVMLEERLTKERRRRLDGLEAEREAAALERLKAQWAEESEEDERRVVRRQQAIEDAVRDVIRAERPEGLDRERLFDRLERLNSPDYEVEAGLYLDTGGDDALVSEQIAAFCKALRLTPDWDLWKETFWAVEEAEDAAQGSPYAARGTGPPSG